MIPKTTRPSINSRLSANVVLPSWQGTIAELCAESRERRHASVGADSREADEIRRHHQLTGKCLINGYRTTGESASAGSLFFGTPSMFDSLEVKVLFTT
jgi:hypothetical protein